MKRRAKIVCTLGPQTSTEDAICGLIEAGMDVARLNFSHGEYDFHREMYDTVRKAATRCKKPVAIMQDLQGPKIRCGKMENGGVPLEAGATCRITTDEIMGTSERFPTSYKLLPRDVTVGDHILLDDGNLSLSVKAVEGQDVVCEVVDGGLLKDKKGINLPNSKVSAPSLTEKDIRDAHFGTELGVDAVALSFVRTGHDVRLLRREIATAKSRPLVIAKLEKPQAIEQLEGIMEEADGVMVARGDLGVEMPPEKVPVIQKRIIDEANRRGRTVIVATQMLESMITNPRPTRAEASDVANAVFDGADALMLSGETAVGRDPRGVVEIMSRIIVEAEGSDRAEYVQTNDFIDTQAAQDFQNAISLASVRAAHELRAEAVCVYTASGATARLISDYRPKVPVLAFVPDALQQRKLAFSWGVKSLLLERVETLEALLSGIDDGLLSANLVGAGDTVVVCTKVPLSSGQRTNTMHLHVVGASRLSGRR